MSIRFAASISKRNPLRRILAREVHLVAANDNPIAHKSQATLDAALRYFAKHGLAAAEEARRLAEEAAQRGDRLAFAQWRDICGALDRRMGRELDRKHAS